MSENNFDNLDQDFNVDMFSNEEQRYDVEDGNLLLTDPELEDQLNDSSANNNAKDQQEDDQTIKAGQRRRRGNNDTTRMIDLS